MGGYRSTWLLRADSQVLKGRRQEQPVSGLLDQLRHLSGICSRNACDALGFVSLSECLRMVSAELDCGKRAMTL